MIYVDLDGTLLADDRPHNLRDWSPNGRRIWEIIRAHEICILSMCVDEKNEAWKKQWIKEQLGHIPSKFLLKNKPHGTKSDICKPGDILIDDGIKHKSAWESKGGRYFHPSDLDALNSFLKYERT